MKGIDDGMRTCLVLTWVFAGPIPDALTAESPAKIYASGPSGIVRMNLDGSEFEVLIDADGRRPGDLAIDRMESKLYWSDGWKIHRSNYDGSQLGSYVDMHPSTWLSAHRDDLTGFSMDIHSEDRLLLFTASFSYHYETNQLAFVNIDDGLGSVSDVEFDDESNAYISGAAIVSTDSSRVLMCYALEATEEGVLVPSCYSHEWRDKGNGYNYLASHGQDWEFLEDYHYFVEEGGNHWIRRNNYNEDILLVEKQLFSCGFDQSTSDPPPQMAMDTRQGVMYVNSSEGRIVGSFCNDAGKLESKEIFLGVQDPPQMVDMAAHDGNVFWSDVQGEIWRWHDDGSEGGSLEKVFAPVVRRPRGLFVDHQAGRILWADPLARTVMQADLKGASVEVIAEGEGDVHDVLVAEGRLYWSEPEVSTIKSANRDGSDAKEILDLQGGYFPTDLDYEPMSKKLYWTSFGYIGRCNLDGSEIEVVRTTIRVEDIAVDGNEGVIYMTGSGSGGETEEGYPGVWKFHFDTQHAVPMYHGYYPAQSIDVLGDRVFWSVPELGYYPWAFIYHSDKATAEQSYTHGRYREVERIAIYRPEGVATALEDPDLPVPGATSLHSNYPNPFNSSTRIPYTVAQGGHVSLTIHNAMGQPVASLVDEVHEAGIYEVVWSTEGEEVLASGVYMVRLKTGDAVRVRKLTLLR